MNKSAIVLLLYILSFTALGVGIYLRKQGNPNELLFWGGVVSFALAVILRKWGPKEEVE